MPQKSNLAVKHPPSLYERLGGKGAIHAAVEQFYERVLADPELRPFFAKTNVKWLKTRQAQFLTQALGGPALYQGQDMKKAHAHLAIEARHFERVAGHLVGTLRALGVPQPLIEEVVAGVAPLAGDIVNTSSSTAGQALNGKAASNGNGHSQVKSAKVHNLSSLAVGEPQKGRGVSMSSYAKAETGNGRVRRQTAVPVTVPHEADVVEFEDDVQSQLEEANAKLAELELQNANYVGQIEAIGKSQAVIEFNMDGTIITANDNFLKTLGYSLDEVKGKHHRMFVDEAYKQSGEYREFWARLNRGEYDAAEYKRFGKGGKEIWIQASYNPILDTNGKPFKVVKYATDVTAQKIKNADFTGQIEAISKAQAVIEFNMDGTIITANDNFLKTLGYSLDEVKGKHHRMFVDEAYKQSGEYREFWARLNRGEYDAAEYKRFGKGGKEIWIQASYNPILDTNGKPFKVVKYATDITAQVQAKIDLQMKVDSILSVVNAAAKGDLTQQVTVKGADAIGQMGEGLAKFFTDLRLSIANIGQNAQALASSSEELTSVSQQMSANAEETAAQSNVVSAASEEVSKNVQTVATGTEEMTASIKEIAKNANEAAKVATGAVKIAETTNATVAKLGESSQEIGKVIKVITSIAQQTNLLALNATIEAARAGEAGKGFAVVANEVKELAKETAKATEDISQKIEAIQADTKGAVEAISEIGGIINQINDISNTIASAVEEQTATTNEMGRNVAEAAKGSSEIAQNITGVAQAAQSTTAGALDTQKAAGELSRMAAELQKMVGQFQY
jgi:methyl-accepting chemotaxis protein